MLGPAPGGSPRAGTRLIAQGRLDTRKPPAASWPGRATRVCRGRVPAVRRAGGGGAPSPGIGPAVRVATFDGSKRTRALCFEAAVSWPWSLGRAGQRGPRRGRRGAGRGGRCRRPSRGWPSSPRQRSPPPHAPTRMLDAARRATRTSTATPQCATRHRHAQHVRTGVIRLRRRRRTRPRVKPAGGVRRGHARRARHGVGVSARTRHAGERMAPCRHRRARCGRLAI